MPKTKKTAAEKAEKKAASAAETIKFRIRTVDLFDLPVDLFACGIFKHGRFENDKIGREARKALALRQFSGELGESFYDVFQLDGRAVPVLFVGLGDKKGFNPQAVRQAAGVAAGEAKARSAARLAIDFINQEEFPFTLSEAVQAAVEGVELKLYKFDKFFEKAKPAPALEAVDLVYRWARGVASGAIERGRLFARATCLARDFINTPPSDCTPSFLAAEAEKIAKEAKLACRIYDEKGLAELKAGGILGVARGSHEKPRLIHLKYTPKGKSRGVVALVGKGITFDSGGLNIKSFEGMMTMKCDMSGAAAVLCSMLIIGLLGSDYEVHGVACATENLLGGGAYKPGDVLRSMNGKTVEVLNTDAEGRLVLMDGLTFAQKQGATTVIDIATLTGAAVVALGELVAAIFSNDKELTAHILKASERSGERFHEMPLEQSYRKKLESPIADLKNIGGKWGGSISAALFLQAFIEDKTVWAHLDIAGPAFMDTPMADLPVGGTGFAVRTLAEMFTHR
jgi:leucyl aminopeptidase